jgi:predicted RNase H-like nuclease (RuvC/YqgF family)
MAKALFGHVGVGGDLRLAAEVRSLRSRIVELERELSVARATSDALAASMTVEDDLRTLTLEGSEPALT